MSSCPIAGRTLGVTAKQGITLRNLKGRDFPYPTAGKSERALAEQQGVLQVRADRTWPELCWGWAGEVGGC